MLSLSEIISANVKDAVRKAGNPTYYRLGKEMARVMERPPGIGKEMYGKQIVADTASRHIARCLAGKGIWRVDYLEALASVLGVSVADLVTTSKIGKKVR